MSSPGATGSGEVEVFVTESSALPATVVEMVALLLPSSESFSAETVAVLRICVPELTSDATATVSVNTTLPGPREAMEQITESLVPTAGVVHDHPDGVGIDTKVVSGGSGSTRLTDVASAWPLLVTVMV